ncbi:ArgE/DapE family deacylase [Nostocoides sp. Soil756]|uniref:ArgE/DapE family deacylase n=1 Tax=Nostocoides sp. Soil756 TaxID=1736399 RepID=UPI0025703347|nr:ArgE/DapE family deacylase [Tetrasphaera sp. Soil756]
MTAPMTPAERAVVEALDPDRLVATLAELVRIPSITGTAAEAEALHLLADRYRAAGLEVDLWCEDVDELRATTGFPGSEAPREEAWGLVGTTPGDGLPALVLQGHVDVVPVGDPTAWTHDPFGGVVEGGRLHGRGACDMKAGVAAALAVAEALHATGLPARRRLALHAVVSEEDGGLGAFATLRRGHTGEVAVINEPTGGRLLVANAGALTFRLEVPGRAAHGSTRLEGVSALDGFALVHAALRELEASRNRDLDPLFAGDRLPYALSVGTVHAGDWASTVPDLLVAEGRLGVALGEDPAEARVAFADAVRRAAETDPWLREHPPVITWPGGQFASGRLAPGHPLADEVAEAAEVAGLARPPVAGAPYGSDLRLYAAAGIPTLQFGPGDVRLAHSAHESVALDEMVAVAQALAVLAVRRLGVG